MDDLYKDLLRFGCLKVSNANCNLFVALGFPRSLNDLGMEIEETIRLRMKHVILGPNLGSGRGESG